ncbi:triosephosphate isomerase [Wolbachia endosymbiont of Ctenocephalides felis wCfeJ]|uniref:triosephosphate isomerase n=1 Tax=Wolbachia endosymbiont of Ctenocephalides felis wCfeJ TaxID=2732594 RepID=UPI001447E1EA|nr:triosephosphate isomerase [Wolbachia endosymbiont of Ctenocephalides felis wCfeJ]WCR57889.1 MAG: Triosephosphate isomerase [Wolbachia endosymbiont of Ctenocephalides felis wCfeJ]
MSFLIVANWKMNGTRSSFVDFIGKLNNKSNRITSKLVICPPFTSFPDSIELSNNVSIGAQNCHHKKSGSYTGEISVEMLKELRCTYIILGHSERINETDGKIKLKSEATIESSLHPIICVGENAEDYKRGKTQEVIEYQCKNRLPTHGEYTVAYEPIWAIGTGHVPSNDTVEEVIEVIKSCTDKKDVIYGGSVSSENIENLLNISNLSGVLIGSASLDFDRFYKIVQQVERTYQL